MTMNTPSAPAPDLSEALPGTIVTFDDPDDDGGRMIATLVPGAVDKAGVLHDLLWTDSYGSEWTLATIEAGNPEIRPRPTSFDIENPEPGLIVTFDDQFDEGFRMVATRTPGSLDGNGELMDVNWVDSYSSHFGAAQILRSNPVVFAV